MKDLRSIRAGMMVKIAGSVVAIRRRPPETITSLSIR
jgi:hypothetical protein